MDIPYLLIIRPVHSEKLLQLRELLSSITPLYRPHHAGDVWFAGVTVSTRSCEEEAV